jgi:hypothetical protein
VFKFADINIIYDHRDISACCNCRPSSFGSGYPNKTMEKTQDGTIIKGPTCPDIFPQSMAGGLNGIRASSLTGDQTGRIRIAKFGQPDLY